MEMGLEWSLPEVDQELANLTLALETNLDLPLEATALHEDWPAAKLSGQEDRQDLGPESELAGELGDNGELVPTKGKQKREPLFRGGD